MRIYANTPDTCETCGDPIIPGELIDDTSTGWVHSQCGDLDDPDLWKAHSSVPLEDGNDLCDECPLCLYECGDGLKEEDSAD